MPKPLALSLVVLTAACASDLPIKEPSVAGKFENACLPEAVILKEALLQAHIESKILIIHATTWSHAAVVYVYPRENPKVWVWDSTAKSLQVRASYDNPAQIAKAWLAEQAKDNAGVRAEFLL